MLGFLLGTAAICAPPQIGVPLGLTIAGVKAIAGRRRNARQAKLHTSDSEQKLEAKFEKVLASEVVEPVELSWTGLNQTLKLKDGSTKQILKGVSGVARPGRLVGLMGPSGSGKTSLLTALAGRVPNGSKMDLTGSLLVNGMPTDSAGHRQAFVQQEDLFYSMLSVKETLKMAADLRLPQQMSAEAREAYVSQLVGVLGLAKAIETCVGDEKTRGLSGGEKKRLSIGCELVGSPSLIFCDEPTTGLDSFQAEKVMSTLKALAGSGHTVVASIHQPRSSIFAMFDDLVLLSEGQPVYSGPADQALAHFEALGHVCPEHFNPAEFLADLISLDFASVEAEADSRARLDKLVSAWRAKEAAAAAAAKKAASAKDLAHAASTDLVLRRAAELPRAGPLKQLRLLLVRSWRQVVRDKATNMARAMSNLSSAIVFGAIFFRMRNGQSSIQDRMGLLQVASINTAMASLVKTLNIFPRERTIVARERARGSYGILPLLTAKLAAELPVGALFPLLFGAIVYPVCGLHPSLPRFAKFLGIITLESFTSQALGLAVGSVAPSTEAAMAIGPAVMLVWIVFGGYYVNADNVPVLFKWLPRASLIKQAFEALCVNEFPGLTFEADANGGGMRTGEQVLTWLSFDKSTIPARAASQARILLFYYWATFCILRASSPRYQSVRPDASAPALAPAAESAKAPAATPATTPAATPAATPAVTAPSQADGGAAKPKPAAPKDAVPASVKPAAA
ncbi:hypothetical protein HXX76_008227 [Chlamydomonas incerta]|uniref:ABC transporter domain-containing protein n=1 Tax=Chlamydomonas incerta TaxID=51695 RepID=A0A835W1U1_CHLIN|nr:hypothetical protein HXX76_008227 [Chlamydomonas incerta]|eukprot:KAG2433874.1 hypothetical protein HXX76_008227 [Chlamydomonas incerta]